MQVASSESIRCVIGWFRAWWRVFARCCPAHSIGTSSPERSIFVILICGLNSLCTQQDPMNPRPMHPAVRRHVDILD